MSDYDRDRDREHKGHSRRRKVCSFCVDKVATIDYKDTNKIRRYITERGKMVPRRMSGTCAYHQRHLSLAIKRARIMALLPYSVD